VDFRSTQHSSLEKHSPPTTEWSPPPKMTLGQYDDEYPLRKTSMLLRYTYMPVPKISKLLLLGDGGGGHWLLVWMEWRPSGWSVCLPLLISPCTIKSRSSLLAPAHPGGPGKRAIKWLW